MESTQQAAISATGKAPPNDLESAIRNTFTPGNYAAIVRGKNNTTGIGLVEAYDLDEAISPTLTNISTRGFVDTDQNVMIGGFISGNGIVRVIVRALGPTLSQFGVTNVLADPVLDVRDAQGNSLALTTIGLPPSRRKFRRAVRPRPMRRSQPSSLCVPPVIPPPS